MYLIAAFQPRAPRQPITGIEWAGFAVVECLPDPRMSEDDLVARGIFEVADGHYGATQFNANELPAVRNGVNAARLVPMSLSLN